MNYFWLFVSFSLVLAGASSIYNLVRTIQSKSWIPVEAKVVESSVKWAKLRSPKYLPKVTYEYSAEGRSYTGNRISFCEYMRFYRACQKVIDQYPAGKSITVYYEPGNPRYSVIQNGGVKTASMILVLVTILTTFILWWVRSRGYFDIIHQP